MIRQAAFAGSFYPADKKSLIKQIDLFLKNAEKIKQKRLRILIVPHAGYDYSGQTAGWGFKQLEGESYSKIILLGSSHKNYFSQAAVYNRGFWQTPLGKVEVDQFLANNLINKSKEITANLIVHQQEHCLEVELPFLQRLLTDFKIVPILLGQPKEKVLAVLGEAIKDDFDEQTLLLISTDLCHYPQYRIANKVDQQTIEAILKIEPDQFQEKITENLDQPGVETCACGAGAVKVGLIVGQKLEIDDTQLINYANSGDSRPVKSQVVGYASLGFYGSQLKKKKTDLLNYEQERKLLEVARKSLEAYFRDGKAPFLKAKEGFLKQNLGVFVTLRKNGRLRGCIGQFESQQPLYQLVQEKAVDAAFNDPRFPPLESRELKDVKIEISLLSPRKKIDDWRKIILGKQGVMIKQGRKRGVFLPQVAEETGWDLETFLTNLCSHKAGLAPNCYQEKETEVFVFTAQVFSEE